MTMKYIFSIIIAVILLIVSISPIVLADEEIAMMKISSLSVTFALGPFPGEIDANFDPPLDFPLGEYSTHITGPSEFIIYTTGDFGSPPPSGTVDPATQTVDLDLSSLHLAIDYVDTYSLIEYGFNDDIALWGAPMSITNNTYSSETKDFSLTWTADRTVSAFIGGISTSVGTTFTIEMSGMIYLSCKAHAGSDRIVFDEVTLDGSQSYDTDGSIVSYQWTLLHRNDAANNTSAMDQTPIIANLRHGFYDVTLVVTDDNGLSDSDTMEIAAIGPKGDFDFDGDIDGLDLEEFAVNFGAAE